LDFENFTETETTPFKLPEWGGGNVGLEVSVDNSYTSLKGNGKEITLEYTMLGLGFQWKRIKIETTISGTGRIDTSENESENLSYFYYSDGNNIHRVDSTKATITRLMYAPALPTGIEQKNSWIWGAGFEWVTISLSTQYDGEKTIKMNHPFVDGGYQWNWTDKYFNIKYKWHWSSGNTNMLPYYAYYVGLGIIL
jgi:hypothetical protein